jgi:hypothetical protein
MRTLFVCTLFAAVCLFVAHVDESQAAQLKTVDEALADTFGDDAQIMAQDLEVTSTELALIEAETGKTLVTDEEKETWTPSSSACASGETGEKAQPELSTVVPFYFASKDGKNLGAAAVVSTPGKWDMVEYLVGMDPKGKIMRVEVLKSSEKRGREVARRTFMKQFEGKTAEDPITVGKDITAVSGATVTSKSAALAVTRATVLYKEFYLKGGASEPSKGTTKEPAGAEAAGKKMTEPAPTKSEMGDEGTESNGD